MPYDYPKPKPKSLFRRWLERQEAYWKLRKWLDDLRR